MSVRVPRRRRAAGGVGEEIRRRHAWLDLLQASGPVLTLPVVHRVFPNGLPGVAQAHRARLRALMSDMLDDHGASRHTVINTMLREVLDWQDHLRIDAEIPDALTDVVMEHRLVLRPDFAFHAEYEDVPDDDLDEDEDDDEDPDDGDDAVDEADEAEASREGDDLAAPSGPWRLLGMYAPWGAHPLDRMTTGGWTASPVERLATLLRARDVPIGLVTDGRWWALVWAPRGGATGAAVWDGALFSEEPQSLQAFVALLQRSRFLAQTAANTLPRMLIESLERQP